MRHTALTMTVAVAVLAAAMAAAHAQPVAPRGQTPTAPSPLDQASAMDEVALIQRLDERIPLDVQLVDELGAPVTLGEHFNARPVVLVPAYYRCPMLCTLVINALVDRVEGVGLKPGRDFIVVVFSIDPRETPKLAAEKKLNYLRRFGSSETQQGWHFLTGEQPAIERLTEALGYRYKYDEKSDQYAHPAAVTVLTPEGKISSYLLGFDYESRDLRLALVDASKGRIGTVVDKVLLRCFLYDPESGRYGFAVMTALRFGGLLTLVGVAGTVLFFGRRRKRLAAREER